MPKKKPKTRKAARTGARPAARDRAPGTALSRLWPEGKHYRDWYDVPHTDRDARYLQGLLLPTEALEFLDRLIYLGPRYNGSFPYAAILLDTMLDTGTLPLLHPDGGISAFDHHTFGTGTLGARDFRDSVHQLHAAAALLVADEGYVRLVVSRPDEPCGRWIFKDEPEARQVPSICIPRQAAEELPPEQYGVLGILRDPETEGPEDAVRKLTAPSNGYTTEQARDLVEAVLATEWVDAKGCAACPDTRNCAQEVRA